MDRDRTVHTRVQNVRAVLRGAVRDRVIATEPSDGVPLPRCGEHAMSIPTPPQVGALLAAADERFAAFSSFGGLRLGEAAPLQVGDVDFLRRRVLCGPTAADERLTTRFRATQTLKRNSTTSPSAMT